MCGVCLAASIIFLKSNRKPGANVLKICVTAPSITPETLLSLKISVPLAVRPLGSPAATNKSFPTSATIEASVANDNAL